MINLKMSLPAEHPTSAVGIAGLTIPTACAVALMVCANAMADETQPAAESSRPGAGQPTDLQEIVVTATRQAQTLSKVPISVAAYSQTTLDELNVKSIDDLSRITPGITFSRGAFGGGNQSAISIRGIQSSVGASTTGIYIDDTPIQVRNVGVTAANAYPKVFDLDRIEVLRGPQGTLFGSGSEGGAVRFITPTPSLTDYSLYGRTEISGIDHGGMNYEGGVAVGGPIVQDELAFRVSGWYRRDGGYVDRVDYFTRDVVAPDSNSANSDAFHATLLWKPASNLLITPSFFYQDLKVDDASTYWEQFSSPGEYYRNAANGPQPASDIFSLPSLKVEWDTPKVNLISNTSYFHRNNHGINDYTTAENANLTAGFGVPNVAFYPLPGEAQAAGDYLDTQDVFTQEIRLQSPDPDARVNWLIGVFYQSERQTSQLAVHDPNLDTIFTYGFGVPTSGEAIVGPELPGQVAFASSQVDHDKQKAGFGQVDVRVVGGLRVSAGVRVSRTEYDYNGQANGPFNGGFSSLGGSQAETPVTPRFGLSYQYDSNNLYYFTAAEGFRPGGANAPVPVPRCSASLARFGITNPPDTYNSDSVWSYEVGAKNRLWDGRLQLDTSAYHIVWRNIQTSIALDCGYFEDLNLGEAVSNGFDFSGQVRATSQLTLGWALGYNDAHYTSTIVTGTTPAGAPALAIRAGDPLGQTPWVASVSGDYRVPLYEHPTFLHVDYQYSSHDSTPLDASTGGYDPDIPRAPAIGVLNARAGVQLGHFEIALFGTNLANTAPEISRWHDNLVSPLFRGLTVRPRTIGIQASVRY